MPLLQYFGWVGGFLLATLLVASWCFPGTAALAPPSDVPLNERITIRIHSEHKGPERVEFGMTRSVMAPIANFDPETDVWPRQLHTPFETFAQVPTCSRQPCELNLSSIEGHPRGNRAGSTTAPHLGGRVSYFLPHVRTR
jgi:hypothetical protein